MTEVAIYLKVKKINNVYRKIKKNLTFSDYSILDCATRNAIKF